MLLRLSRLLPPVLLALAGCGDHTTIALDGGSDDAPEPPPGRLVIEGEETRALMPGDHARFVARWVDAEGRAVVGGDVTFALEGLPRDSTLLALGDRTDTGGRVEGTVVAGREAATFRVRVSATNATPAYLEFAVSADGFGRLVVSVEGVDRRDVAQRVVILHQATDPGQAVECADALTRPEGDRARTTDDAGEVTFTTLPATARFAVVARALGTKGATVAEGCVEGVAVPAGGEARATVALVPRVLGVEGEYGAELALAIDVPARTTTDSMLLTIESGIRALGGDAALFLDALEVWLRTRGWPDAADALAEERDSGGATDALEALLDGGGASPTRALRNVLADVAAFHEQVRVTGTFFVAASSSGPVASFTRTGVNLGGTDRDLAVSLAALGPARVPSEVRWSDEDDVLEVRAMPVALPLGSLLLAALDALGVESGIEDGAALVAERSGCSALAEWVESRPVMVEACGASCVSEVCREVGERVVGILSAAAAPVDSRRARIVLAGALSGEDSNGDLEVDALDAGALVGTWTSADGEALDTMSVSFTGARVAGPE